MYEFSVQGVGCGSCVRKIEQAVKAVDPGAIVEVDIRAANVRVESHLTADALAKAISAAGYPARDLADS